MSAQIEFDLDDTSWRSLELPALLDVLALGARTPPGRRLIQGLRPVTTAGLLDVEFERVEEARGQARSEGRFLAAELPDPLPAIESLGLEGLRLEVAQLHTLARWALAGDDVRRRLRGAARERTRLAALAPRISSLQQEARAVLDGLGPDGRIADGASPELGRIRRRLDEATVRLRRKLERRLHEPGEAATIRDDFVTRRNGRFVIPVRTDAPKRTSGIVHGTSSSGATLFVEPLDVVESNNELVALVDAEHEEEARIVALWTEAFRSRREQMRALVDTLALLDSLEARAEFAERTDAVNPAWTVDGSFELVGLRHPLLERHLAESGRSVVPIDLVLEPGDRLLLVSGPNAGGKTLALKSCGLAVTMAHSGIPVPAVRCRLPRLEQLRVEIGDHQSIEADLSTFSAHVSALARYLEQGRAPALFLLDEIGGGTEPGEGAALARAVLEALGEAGVITVATTHLGALKAWAVETPGVASAAMEFDHETLRPTYRILPGVAGISAGLQMAERVGLDPRVVERAAELVGRESRLGEDYLTRLRELIRESEQRAQRVARGEAELEQLRQAWTEREATERRRRAREARTTLERALEKLQRSARRELETIGDESERRRAQRRIERRLERESGKARSLVEAAEGERSPREPVGELRAGMPVHVRSLGRDGVVVGWRGDKVEVRMGSVGVRVDRADLAEGADLAPARSVEPRRRPVASDTEQEEIPRELVLVGQRIEEGLERLDVFLDRATLAGHDEVRVVHGHGTGRLRRAVREYLRRDRRVEKVRAGNEYEGGDGASVAQLH